MGVWMGVSDRRRPAQEPMVTETGDDFGWSLAEGNWASTADGRRLPHHITGHLAAAAIKEMLARFEILKIQRGRGRSLAAVKSGIQLTRSGAQQRPPTKWGHQLVI